MAGLHRELNIKAAMGAKAYGPSKAGKVRAPKMQEIAQTKKVIAANKMARDGMSDNPFTNQNIRDAASVYNNNNQIKLDPDDMFSM